MKFDFIILHAHCGCQNYIMSLETSILCFKLPPIPEFVSLVCWPGTSLYNHPVAFPFSAYLEVCPSYPFHLPVGFYLYGHIGAHRGAVLPLFLGFMC